MRTADVANCYCELPDAINELIKQLQTTGGFRKFLLAEIQIQMSENRPRFVEFLFVTFVYSSKSHSSVSSKNKIKVA